MFRKNRGRQPRFFLWLSPFERLMAYCLAPFSFCQCIGFHSWRLKTHFRCGPWNLPGPSHFFMVTRGKWVGWTPLIWSFPVKFGVVFHWTIMIAGERICVPYFFEWFMFDKLYSQNKSCCIDRVISGREWKSLFEQRTRLSKFQVWKLPANKGIIIIIIIIIIIP